MATMTHTTFDDYRTRISMQDVLTDAGYTFDRKGGLRYPSYVRLDSSGHKIKGDKFIISGGGQCCFRPPEMRNYNIISFIREHPTLFPDFRPGMQSGQLINKVCCRLLSIPVEERKSHEAVILSSQEPFRMEDYTLHRFENENRESHRPFFPYFYHRGIDLRTQSAFHESFFLATRETSSGKTLRNLAFPMTIPGAPDTVVGLEERGRRGMDGKAFKGMARGTNASEGMWIASPAHTELKDAKRVLIFESAYDAMAYYQLMMSGDSSLGSSDRKELREAVYISTGGTPSQRQTAGLLKESPSAIFHLGFDADAAGERFAEQFRERALEMGIPEAHLLRELPSEGYKDFNDELISKRHNMLHPLHPSNVPPELRAYVNSFRNGTEIPSCRDILSPSIFDDIHTCYLPKPLKSFFDKYVSAKEQALKLCCSPFVHPEDKGAAIITSSNAYKTFRGEMCKALGIMPHHLEEEDRKVAEKARKAQDDDTHDNEEDNDRKIQHDVDYTTHVDENGNMEIEEDVNDQEEKKHFRR